MFYEDYSPKDQNFDKRFLTNQEVSVQITILYDNQLKCFVAYTENYVGFGKTKGKALDICIDHEIGNLY